jgi:hypothetical protein
VSIIMKMMFGASFFCALELPFEQLTRKETAIAMHATTTTTSRAPRRPFRIERRR